MPRSGKTARWLTPIVPCAAVAAAMILFSLAGKAHPVPVGVTWNGTVARTLERRCVTCHGDAGLARPRLTEYEPARHAAQAIKRAVLTRHMPQWHATSGFGEFANDPGLTAHEIELLAQWADALAPLGDGPAAVAAASPGAPGPPDLTLTVPGSDGADAVSRTFWLQTGAGEDRWIRGWTFRPANPALTSAAIISLESGATLGTWTAGESPTFLPSGVAQRLPSGEGLRLTVHYRGSAPREDGGTRVGLYFAERPAREIAHLALPCGATRVPQPIDVLAVRPRLGSAAWSLAVVARRPDGGVEPLGRFQQYPATHAQTYWLRRPVTLPAGSSIDVGATHGTCGAELAYVPHDTHVGSRTSRRSGYQAGAHEHSGATTSLEPNLRDGSGVRPEAPAAASAEYWCPMHATVRSPMRGVCHQCGMDLVPVTPAIEGKYGLDVGWVPGPGTTGMLRLVVRAPGTQALVRDFERVHEQPFHLFIISDDLRQFSHVHPVAQPDGALELTAVSLPSGPYQLFADFLPVGGTPQLIRAIIPAALADGFSGSRTPHLAPDMTAKTDGGLRVRLDAEGLALTAGAPGLVAFHLEDAASGLPVSDLEPYLGAWGHAFIVSADMRDAVHSHPLTPLTSPGGPTVYFQQRFPRPGTYRMWVQFQRRGVLSTVPFTINVTDASATGWLP